MKRYLLTLLLLFTCLLPARAANPATLFQFLAAGFQEADGDALVGGTALFYESGYAGDSGHTKYVWLNPGRTATATSVMLGGTGQPPGGAIVYGDGLYDVVVKDAAGVTLFTVSSVDVYYKGENLTASGSFTVTGDLSVGDDATITDDLAVGGDETVAGGLTVTGVASIGGDLAVSGASTNFRNAIKKVDGAGSGIDTDTVDGYDSSAFALFGSMSSYVPVASYTAVDVLAKLLTVDTNDSGLNSQFLGGLATSAFSLASHTHANALDDLSDVTIASPSVGQVLSYNGSAWINAVASSGQRLAGVAYSGQTVQVTAPAILVHFYISGSSPVVAVMSLTKTGELSYDLKVDGVAPSGTELITLTTLSFQYGAGFSGSGDFTLVFF